MGGEGRGSLPWRHKRNKQKIFRYYKSVHRYVVNLGKSAGGKNRCPVGQKIKDKRWKKVYNTWCSQAVTHLSTNHARRCLTAVIGREPVFSTWYGRRHLCEKIGAYKYTQTKSAVIRPFLATIMISLLSSYYFNNKKRPKSPQKRNIVLISNTMCLFFPLQPLVAIFNLRR